MTFTDNANVEQSRILLNSTRGISVLTLKNVSIYDAGTYLCSTENAVSGMEIQVYIYYHFVMCINISMDIYLFILLF